VWQLATKRVLFLDKTKRAATLLLRTGIRAFDVTFIDYAECRNAFGSPWSSSAKKAKRHRHPPWRVCLHGYHQSSLQFQPYHNFVLYSL
jgi:hypothetical protein